MAGKELSVVVPTYNEVDNIRPLTERLFKALRRADINADLLFMDDESAGTPRTEEIVKELQREGFPARIHVRRRAEGRGLSSAVLLGFEKARFDTVLCMDADLQHEPESVPDVAFPVLTGKAEFSVGSRNVDGGGLGFDWSLFRRTLSAGATLLAIGVARSTDPMSGFFCTTKAVLARGRKRINPIGFKIGLEIMARCKANPIKDVAITFQPRLAGESKLSMKENVLYLRQLASLYWDNYAAVIIILVLLAVYFVYYILTTYIL